VTDVSWHDANRFCQRLTGALGHRKDLGPVRLPWEIEWEYAATCGGRTKPHGSGNLAHSATGTGREQPYSVELESLNLFLIGGLGENVGEWVGDAYEPDRRNLPLFRKSGRFDDPQRAKHVVRGQPESGLSSDASGVERIGAESSESARNRGFRIAIGLPAEGR
jgi:formylglycine-generating enzyme required for sulfatase activity